MSDEVVVKGRVLLTTEQKKAKKSAYNAAYRLANLATLQAYQAAYRLANKASTATRDAAYRSANLAAVQARELEYRQKNSALMAAKSRAYYHANKETILLKIRAYRASNKDKIAACAARWRAANKRTLSNSKSVYYLANKARIAARNYERYAKNPEIQSVYARTAKAKRAHAEGTHTHLDIKSLFTSQRGTCPNCQSPLIKRGAGKYHVDHVTPIALGGSNWPDNIQLLCPPCNLDKGAKHPDVWMTDNPRKRPVDFTPF